jgi:hypothetical protein
MKTTLRILSLPFLALGAGGLLLAEFLRGISWPIAWSAAKRLASILGVIGLIAWFGSLHYYLILPSILFLSVLWFLLYKIEYGWRSRRTFGEQA